MLLEREIVSGEIYVNDKDDLLLSKEEPVSLWQLVEAPVEKIRHGMLSPVPETYTTQPIWENIFTKELVRWGTHCFTTIDRIKEQYNNIDKLHNEKRVNFLKDAMEVIEEYEKSMDIT